ncbi:hypothetical protein [endosymbiont of Ridgeia piscesae]|jgi:hypothetical protein|uniref:Uncharacterized protein n=1 Tax=endosymbiont of Ridgeia piscesae TaxID=54398 RepID=A0A0T5YWJ1_9GAMM|nr:hypothetical protein [endosymbiont of Ridgeia piscesae]KRT54952.1 hypothetical protein Ga0074115_1127 [endosymbiont of Ridgeia piscesae]KRT56757.1 hypothetical protein Ga0076813_10221 [endosymbiont of Ridgeia piscesae]
MSIRPPPGPGYDKTLILFLLACTLFSGPLLSWWTSSDSPWYIPYLIWLLVILFGALLQRRTPDDP